MFGFVYLGLSLLVFAGLWIVDPMDSRSIREGAAEDDDLEEYAFGLVLPGTIYFILSAIWPFVLVIGIPGFLIVSAAWNRAKARNVNKEVS